MMMMTICREWRLCVCVYKYIISMLQQHVHCTWATTIIKVIIFVTYGACWVCLCCHNPQNSDVWTTGSLLSCAHKLMHAIAHEGDCTCEGETEQVTAEIAVVHKHEISSWRHCGTVPLNQLYISERIFWSTHCSQKASGNLSGQAWSTLSPLPVSQFLLLCSVQVEDDTISNPAAPATRSSWTLSTKFTVFV